LLPATPAPGFPSEAGIADVTQIVEASVGVNVPEILGPTL
jgi:hypothetical protein